MWRSFTFPWKALRKCSYTSVSAHPTSREHNASQWSHWILAIGLAVGVYSTVCVGGFYLFGVWICGEISSAAIQSRDGKFGARIIERNCGATTPFHTRVVAEDVGYHSIVPRWYKEETVFEVESALQVVAIEWTGERQLTISYSRNAEERIEVQRDSWDDVQILYEVVDGLP